MRISDWSSDVCSSDLADAHAAGVAAGGRPAMEPGDGFETEFVELVLGDDETRRGGVVLLARIARGDHAAFERAQLAQRVHAGVGAIALVMRENERIALALRHAYRHQFIVEQHRKAPWRERG